MVAVLVSAVLWVRLKIYGYILLQLLVICYEVHYPVNDIIFCNFWIDNTSPYLFAQAITKYHRLDGLNNRHLLLSVPAKGSPSSRCRLIWFLVRTLFLAHRQKVWHTTWEDQGLFSFSQNKAVVELKMVSPLLLQGISWTADCTYMWYHVNINRPALREF